MKINVSNSVTINTGNYTSIRPSVSIELDIKDPSKFDKAVENISSLVDDILHLEAKKLSDSIKEINNIGVHAYTSTFSEKDIMESIKKTMKNLTHDTTTSR